MIIKIEAKSNFGVLAGGTWFNPSDKKMLSIFEIGKTYDVEMVENTGKGGKVYKNIQTAKLVEGSAAPVAVLDRPAAAVVAVKKPYFKKSGFAPKSDAAPVDWAAKDRSQLVGGRSHDAVELVKASISGCKPMDEVLALYREALVGVLSIAEEVK